MSNSSERRVLMTSDNLNYSSNLINHIVPLFGVHYLDFFVRLLEVLLAVVGAIDSCCSASFNFVPLAVGVLFLRRGQRRLHVLVLLVSMREHVFSCPHKAVAQLVPLFLHKL